MTNKSTSLAQAHQQIVDAGRARWGEVEKNVHLDGLSAMEIEWMQTAWIDGFDSGMNAYIYTDLERGENRIEAAFESELLSHDYSPFEFIAEQINDLDETFSEGLTDLGWTLRSEGVTAGIETAVLRERLARRAANRLVEDYPDAFLWDEPASPGRITCYAHRGQHCEADSEYFDRCTVPARLSHHKVQGLKRELERMGYVLRIVKRRPTDSPPLGPNETRVTFRNPILKVDL